LGIQICALKPNQTLLVSTAAGATGFLACQIAKIQTNCRVVGLTGSDEKCDFLSKNLNIDAVLNYNDKDLISKLKKSCPNGIDAYFDNIGEEMLSNVLKLMNNFGRVALCGAMGAYGDFRQRKGVVEYKNIIFKRILMRGFAFAECMDRFDEIFEFF
jgi:NADPH-dependent curcumin reductase CurA